MNKRVSIPVWVLVLILILSPLYVSWANTQYRKLAIFNSTIDSTTLGATSPSSIVGTTLKINNSMLSSGGGFKHQRFGATCTTAATQYASCSTTLTWSTPFADANYTPICWVRDGGNEPLPLVEQAGSRTAASVQVLTIASTNLAAFYSGVNCIAFHD